MNRKSGLPIPEPILQLQRQLEQFRSTRPAGTKLPEPLWQAAVELARQHGVYPVAHPLRLDYARLKQRLGGAPTRHRKAPKPAFVELVAPRSAALEDCLHRVRVRKRWQDAHPAEGIHSARLGEPATRLAGCRTMIQITAQMRVLVAIEWVDGRKGIENPTTFLAKHRNPQNRLGLVF